MKSQNISFNVGILGCGIAGSASILYWLRAGLGNKILVIDTKSKKEILLVQGITYFQIRFR